jgi:hypothetical protein
MRRKFEQFCSRVALDVRRNSDGFKSTLTDGAWLGWREAFAVFQSDVDSLRARVAELEAERADLVKDRERLDALASILSSKDIRIEDGFSGIDLVIFDYNGDEVCEHSGKDLRQAIDAAREGEAADD